MILIFLLLLIIIMGLAIFLKKGNVENYIKLQLQDKFIILSATDITEENKSHLLEKYNVEIIPDIESFIIKEDLLDEILEVNIKANNPCEDKVEDIIKESKDKLFSFSDNPHKVLVTLGLFFRLKNIKKNIAIFSTNLLPLLFEYLVRYHNLLTYDELVTEPKYDYINDKSVEEIFYNKKIQMIIIKEIARENTEESIKSLKNIIDSTGAVIIMPENSIYNGFYKEEVIEVSNRLIDLFAETFHKFFINLHARTFKDYEKYNTIIMSSIIYAMLQPDTNNILNGILQKYGVKNEVTTCGVSNNLVQFCSQIISSMPVQFQKIIDIAKKIKPEYLQKIIGAIPSYPTVIKNEEVLGFLKEIGAFMFYVELLEIIANNANKSLVIFADDKVCNFLKDCFAGFESIYEKLGNKDDSLGRIKSKKYLKEGISENRIKILQNIFYTI